MSLFKEWKKLIENQTDETFKTFWAEYSEGETKIYTYILANYPAVLSGTFSEMVEKLEIRPAIFMGFLDGINSSLNNENNLEEIAENDNINLDIDFEKLYYNMLVAEADYLYGIAEWEKVLTEDQKEEILKTYKRSKTVHKEKEPGRNDPCPCGSGKKYKKCCGSNK